MRQSFAVMGEMLDLEGEKETQIPSDSPIDFVYGDKVLNISEPCFPLLQREAVIIMLAEIISHDY